MVAIENMIVKCPYCGESFAYKDVAYDYYCPDFKDGAILDTELMRCAECGKYYFATAKYELVEITTSKRRSE